jgi:hypothetical protein
MPRKPVESVSEFRMTMGAFEREQLKDFKTIETLRAAGLPLGLAAVGVGIALAGLFFKKGLELIPDEIGADEATREDVNNAVLNTPSESAFTPEHFEGMSPYEIYSIVHEYLVDLRKASYEAWLNYARYPIRAPDNSTNFNIFNSGNNMAILYGVSAVTIAPIFVEVSADATGGDYSPFAYQCAIRETASRRRMVNQADIFQLTKLIAAVIPAAGDWKSERVSEAPAYLDDPLLWTAWARLNFPSSASTLAGADSPVSLSYYFPVFLKSLVYEEHIVNMYESFTTNPTEWAMSEPIKKWWPTQLPEVEEPAEEQNQEEDRRTGQNYEYTPDNPYHPDLHRLGDQDGDGIPNEDDPDWRPRGR